MALETKQGSDGFRKFSYKFKELVGLTYRDGTWVSTNEVRVYGDGRSLCYDFNDGPIIYGNFTTALLLATICFQNKNLTCASYTFPFTT